MSPRQRRWAITSALLAAGMSLAYSPIFSGAVLAGRDAFRLFIPASALILESLSHGELPLWNPYMRLGQPMAATLISQGLYPFAILTSLLAGPVWGVTLRHLLHILIAWAGAYRLGRTLRQSHVASCVAASAFALSPMLTDLGGHQNVVDAAAWSGWMAAGWLALVQRPTARRAFAAAAFTSLSFLAGSPETLLWQLVLCAALALAARPRKSAVGPMSLAAVSAAAFSAFLLLPAAELFGGSGRGAGRTDQLDWSTSAHQLLAMVWPLAEMPRQAYWDSADQWWMVTVFVGTLTGALAALSLRRSRRVIPLAACAALFAAISLGANFAPAAALWHVPPLHFFRFPAKFLVGIAFCLALLAGAGVDRVAVLARRRPQRMRATGVLLAAVTALVGGSVGAAARGLLREGAARGAPWAWAWLLALALVALWVPRRRVRLVVGGLALLELAAFTALPGDFGWAVPKRFAQASALAARLPPGFAGRVSLAVTDDLVGPDQPDFLDLSRDALVPNRHLEDRVRALEGYGAIEPPRSDEFHMAGNRSVFDLAGVEFYLRRKGGPPYADLQEVSRADGLPTLYRSTTAAPRAFVVQRAVHADDGEALKQVLSPDEPWRTTAFLSDGEPADAPRCDGSAARITAETTSTLSLEVDACADGYLVVSNSYAPGWRAEVDGQLEPVRRANYALQAVHVGAGHHVVKLRYQPLSFTLGWMTSLLAATAWAAYLGWALWSARASRSRT